MMKSMIRLLLKRSDPVYRKINKRFKKKDTQSSFISKIVFITFVFYLLYAIICYYHISDSFSLFFAGFMTGGILNNLIKKGN